MTKTRMLFTLALAAVVVLAALGGGRRLITPRTAEAFPGADNVAVVSQQCLPNNWVRINLSWVTYGLGAQWVDLSLANNGFAPFTFVGLGPVPAAQATFTWDGLIPGRTHYLRVNTLTQGGWFASSTIAFLTRNDCGSASAFPGADNLQLISQQCLPNNWVRVNIGWTTYNQGVQWVDLSLFDTGFAPFTFIGLGPFASNVSSVAWDGLIPGRTHYIRVNTLTAGGWFPSRTLVFTTRNDCQNLSGFSTSPTSIDGNTTGNEQGLLEDVRIGEHPQDGFDRIVFEFDDKRPDVQARYVDDPQFCGSGAPVNLPGSHTLVVRFRPAVAHDEMGDPTAPAQVDGTGDAILAARSICDFEGIVSWALGIDGRQPFRVTTLSNPTRIVVDVQR